MVSTQRCLLCLTLAGAFLIVCFNMFSTRPEDPSSSVKRDGGYRYLQQLLAFGQERQEGTTPGKAMKVDPTPSIAVRKTADMYDNGHRLSGQRICPDRGKDLKVVIIVPSSPENFEDRNCVRETWGQRRPGVGLGFILGQTTDKELEDAVIQEASRFDDLILGNSLDTYMNLTLKVISMLEWVGAHCPLPPFVLKADDDLFVNVNNLLKFIESHSGDKRSIYGRLASGWPTIRNKESKWYVSPEQFVPEWYPDFTTGPAYIFTQDAVKDLYKAALDRPFFFLEDVHVTGLAAEAVNVTRHSEKRFRTDLEGPEYIETCSLVTDIAFHAQNNQQKYQLDRRLKQAGNYRC